MPKLRSSLTATLALLVLLVGQTVGAQSAPKPGAANPAGVKTEPHRAAYAFSLKRARSDSGIVDVRGGMIYEIVDACDGWTVNQKIILVILNKRSREIRSVTSYSSWESKDGTRFRFNTRTTRDGRVSERYRGTATLRADGSGGEAVFTLPKSKRMKLPRNSVFPTAHSEAVMAAAVAGKPFVWRVMFDGTTGDGPYGVSALIGKARTSQGEDERKIQPIIGRLGAGRFWGLKLAFYPIKSLTAEPEYVLSIAMHANSVARWLVMDYGSFVIDAQLVKTQNLAKARC